MSGAAFGREELGPRHAAAVLAARAGLAAHGLLVDDELALASRWARETRLTCRGEAPGSGVGDVLVRTESGLPSVARSRSLPLTESSPDRVLAVLAAAPWSASRLDAATNDEVRRVVELADALSPGVRSRVFERDDDRDRERGDLDVRRRLRRVIVRPVTARRAPVLTTIAVLTDLASGAPLEWAVRRYLAREGATS